MNITELSVKRPTAIIMALVLVIGLGILGYTSLGADLLPSVDTPVISIVTTYNGADVEEIEKSIIKPIEDAVCGISGVDSIRSGAAVGYGYTTIKFKMDVATDTAFVDVQQALGDITSKLPKDASKPVLKKFDKNAQPVLMISVSGDVPYDELYKQSDKLKQEIEKVQGVGNVTLIGAMKKELSVKIDKTAIEYYGIGINTVVGKLNAENMNIPAGQIKQEAKTQTVRVVGEFSDIDEIKNLRIPTQGGSSVRLSDIAEVGLNYPDSNEYLRLNNSSSIGIFIRKQSDANIVETTKKVRNRLDELQAHLPKGVKIVVARDESTFINQTLSEVQKNLIEGIITTSIVLLLFLRRWRPSLIVLVAIPTSLIATFFCMYMLKFTLNIMSLMGLSVCIGILVDDSIVVLENIQRHLRMGKNPIRAAIDGRNEIGMAAIAITLCDVVVFGPVAFMSDMIGKFFREFGLTVVFATLFSLLVSFTLTPLMASRLLKKEDAGEGEEDEEVKSVEKKKGLFGKIFEGFQNAYKTFLIWSLNNRWKVISIVTAGIVLSASLIPLKFIGMEFMPVTDQSKLAIDIKLTPGSPLAQTDEKVKTIEKYLQGFPEIKEYFSQIGSESDKSSASITVNLLEKNKRKKNQTKIAGEIREWGKKLDGVSFSVTEASLMGATSADGSKPLAVKITGSEMNMLKQISMDVEKIVKSIPGVTDVENPSRITQNEISVKVDRLAAAEFGFMASDIAGTLRTAIQGQNSGVYRKNGDEYDIVVKFADNQVKTPTDISSIKVTNNLGQQVSLSQVASITMTDSQQEILRQDKQKMVTISANINGRTLGDVNNDIKEKLKTLNLPNSYEIKFGGDQENMNTSFSSLIKALIASILLVYMILVVLYESYLTPVIRMLSLPCGAIGAFLALAITGNSINIVTMIGFIMLDGLASKNGTLLIDYTNGLMKKGMPLREALIEAGTTRFRPILMTTVTMIVGMVPAALAMGEGSEIKSGMAIVLIGGMITSTILSPVLLPVVYTLIDDLRTIMSRKKEKNLVTDGGTSI